MEFFSVSMLAMQELGCFQQLCTDPCHMCIIMLLDEVMVMDELHNKGP